MARPMNLGHTRVHFVYYDTPQELVTLLRRIDPARDAEPLAAASTIVLAVPGKLRAFMGWSTKGAPRPEVHGDVLVFQPPKP